MNPFTIQKILVPTDLSHTSLKALDTAVAIAVKHKAALQLLNIIEPSFDALADENDSSITHLSTASDVLTALAGTIQYSKELKLNIIQAEGNVTENIIKHAFLHHCDLIIMGTHGASGYRDGFIGSNTYRVIKHSACPVLTVPPTGKYNSFKNVLFPIRPVSGALLRYDIVCHFLSSQSSMDVLGLSYNKINPDTNILEKLIEEVKEDLEMDKVKAKPSWGEGQSVAEDVLHHMQQTHPDLLVVTPVLDVITKHGFTGPHTQKIINCSRVPVLSIKKASVPAFP